MWRHVCSAQPFDTEVQLNWTMHELLCGMKSVIYGENGVSLLLYDLIHDVSLWNVCLLKHCLFFVSRRILNSVDLKAFRRQSSKTLTAVTWWQHSVWSWRFAKCLGAVVTIAPRLCFGFIFHIFSLQTSLGGFPGFECDLWASNWWGC